MSAAVVKQDYHIINALNADWDQLRRTSQDIVPRWSVEHQVLAGCTDLDDVLAAIRTAPDAVLAVLLAENARGEQLAGRVVLQAMLGKVVRMASRDARASVDDYVSALWCHIQSYPLATRAARIAANLALDTLKAVTRERAWARPGVTVVLVREEEVLDHHQSQALDRGLQDHNPAATMTASSVIGTAGRLGLIDDQTRDVLLSVYADGLTGVAAARHHQTTPAMIRYRCSRAVRRLARDPASLAVAA